jgi:hypothetical protein
MKRIVIVTALILSGVLSAQADNSIYNNARKQARGDYELHLDAQYCDQRVGPDKNGSPTSAQYRRCMLGRGWRLVRTVREKTWIDPETGLTCHDILGGFGSSCSNF